MKRTITVLALIAAACAAIPAAAQDALETVMVTGSRSSDSDSQPYVVLKRRADHLVTSITVEDDTRDQKLRQEEMRNTLRAVIREAKRDSRITLSVVKKDTLKDFTEDLIDLYITAGSRPDTSRARILVKTAITANDTFEGATGRIDDFVKRVPRIGRSETTNDEDWELTVVGPQQYHPGVVAKIAQDIKETLALFGPGYGVQIEGLYRPVQWYRAGQLDLAIYIPYNYTIAPRRTE